MKRKLLFLAAALGMSLVALLSPAPVTALYPTCSDVYCSTYPGAYCTCPKYTQFWNICSSHWREGCPLIP
jgi:hypothetical protein